jgi:hypothetical protein
MGSLAAPEFGFVSGTPVGIVADWLDENGRTDEGRWVRHLG